MKQHIIKFLVMFILFISWSLFAESISKSSILGTWYEKDNMGSAVTRFLSDGTWTAEVTYLDLLTNMRKTASVNGTWKIIDGKLVKKITWAKEAKLKGQIFTYSILSASPDEIKYREITGKAGKLTRIKKK